MADTQKTINCPACGKEMKKVYVEGINIDICTDGCGGMFFDNRELEKFDDKIENADEILSLVKDKAFEPVDTEAIRKCPVCNTPMVKMGAKGDVIIDVCNVCGAKFLDNKELETIREAILTNKQVDAELSIKLQDMETKNNREMYGAVGLFLQKYWPSSTSRQVSENIVKKIIER